MADDLDVQLLANIKRDLSSLTALAERAKDHWAEEDLVYRFWHQSFKVYAIQDLTPLRALLLVWHGCLRSVVRHHRSSDHRRMTADTRTYRFTLFVNVEPGHPAYDDPEWAADAAWGTLTNEYGLRAIYTDIEDVDPAFAL